MFNRRRRDEYRPLDPEMFQPRPPTRTPAMLEREIVQRNIEALERIYRLLPKTKTPFGYFPYATVNHIGLLLIRAYEERDRLRELHLPMRRTVR